MKKTLNQMYDIPYIKEEQTGKPEYYAIKLLDEEIELIAYKKERLSWFKDNLELEVPVPLKKKLLIQSTITSVNRVWNEIYNLLTA